MKTNQIKAQRYARSSSSTQPVKGFLPHGDGSMVQIAIRLPAPVFNAIASKADEEGQAVSAYMRRLLVHLFNANTI